MLVVLADIFADQVAAWHFFYSVAGGAGAGLLGLLFVAMSQRVNPAGREFEIERHVWALAGGVLAMYADVLLIALVFQIPDQTPVGVGLPVLMLGAVALLIDLATLVVTRSIRTLARSLRWALVIPLVGCLLQVCAGAGIIMGQAVWLHAMAIAIGILLAMAVLASWVLLSDAALAKVRGSAAPASPPRPVPETPRRRIPPCQLGRDQIHLLRGAALQLQPYPSRQRCVPAEPEISCKLRSPDDETDAPSCVRSLSARMARPRDKGTVSTHERQICSIPWGDSANAVSQGSLIASIVPLVSSWLWGTAACDMPSRKSWCHTSSHELLAALGAWPPSAVPLPCMAGIAK